MRHLRAVIVDWAGTIVDFGSCAPAAAFVELFRRHGVAITAAEARAPMGMAKRDHVAAILAMPAVAARLAAAAVPEVDVDVLYRELVPLQMELLPHHATPIPGAPEAFAAWRAAGLRIGSTTGYNREMMDVLAPLARALGVAPDNVITASDVRAARPAPWMALESAARLGVYPMSAVVKIGDTLADIDEGRNAGMWTIGITATGNELALSEEEAAALAPAERDARVRRAGERLTAAGAHAVAGSVAACLPVLEEIERRAAAGERP